jgi:gluconate 5-dehydrogenase
MPFYSFTPQQLRRAMDVNYLGYFAVTQAFMPVFIEQGKGRIINIGADDHTIQVRGFAPIGPTRAASNALTMIMAREFEGTAITANLLTPGGFVSAASMPGDAPVSSFGQILSPDIMSDPAAFLCSSYAEGINGEHIVAASFHEWIANSGLKEKWDAWTGNSR